MMQVSIEVEKDLYDQVANSGVDMQRKFNEYLRSQLEENSYIDSLQFQEDKRELEQTLAKIKNGTAKMISHEEMCQEIENFSRDH